MSKDRSFPIFNRELSWLAFSHRVLQEALDPSVPLFNRLDFLAIFSSNLDEFFRVRVASWRSLARGKPKSLKKLDFEPAALLRDINDTVVKQQALFGEILRRRVLPELERHGIALVESVEDNEVQNEFLHSFFRAEVRPHLSPLLLTLDGEVPFLKDRTIYLVAELWPRLRNEAELSEPDYGLIEVPSPALPRFVTLPSADGVRQVMFLDDVIRHNLPELFPEHEVGAVHAVKLSRDADLYLEDEFSGSVVEAVRKSLKKRETGLPCRFLYDLSMSPAMLTHLKRCFGLSDEDLVLGGRYHNLHDLFSFPRFDVEGLSEEPLPPLPHPELEGVRSLMAAVAEKDRILHFPYQRYGYVTDFLEEAADDPDVEEVWITLYRVARDSAVVKALIRAAQQGKRVTAFVEVQARFDEASNLEWAERMEAAGVRTVYSMPGLKVHAKLALVVRREGVEPRLLAYLSTGNFNEKTARIYSDHALLTADRRITEDVRRVFGFLTGEAEEPEFQHLLVAPFTLRERLYEYIDGEAQNAKNGLPAGMILKMNSLEDSGIIKQLYKAGRAGVPIQLLVRGICCLVPGAEGLSETIQVRSIVDRFLEHARVYIFHDGGRDTCYLASADWMSRNLSRRVEVAFPIYDEAIRREIREIIDLQLADTAKARTIDSAQSNLYLSGEDRPGQRAQTEIYRLLRERAEVALQRDLVSVPA